MVPRLYGGFRYKNLFTTESNIIMNGISLKNQLNHLGIDLNIETGHLQYKKEYLPLQLDFELIFVRHGETFGNCGQVTAEGKIDEKWVLSGKKDSNRRVFQGDIDKDINQLTALGKSQALQVADELKQQLINHHWVPDIILLSPLGRAKDTAIPFIRQNQFEDRVIVCEGIKEISFGAWENSRVCDKDLNDPCHSFYLKQNALVKSSEDSSNNQSENFSEVLLRAHHVLLNLNKSYSGKKIIMFSHSMFGAACSILLGKGQNFENENYIAFDGKRKNGSSYTIPNATPVFLNSITKNTNYKNIS